MEQYKNIKELLKKYLEGESTLAEEKTLKAYFASEKVDPELEEYQPLFGYFEAEAKKTYEGPERKNNSRKTVYTWFAVAASIAIIVGIFLFKPASQHNLGTIENPELAMQKTKEALRFISREMNSGKEKLIYLTEINDTKEKLITK